jgi:hypothetical protein
MAEPNYALTLDGWLPDSGRHPRYGTNMLFDSAATPSGKANLSLVAPAVMDQNLVGACVGHGGACAVTTAFCAAGQPLFGFDAQGFPVSISQRDGYGGARCIDLMLDGLPNTTQLTDSGTEVLSVIRFYAEWGCRKTDAPMVAVDPDTGESYGLVNSDCVPANCNDKPVFGELEQDSLRLVPRAHQIASTGAQRVTDVCLSLDAKCPVVIGTFVDSAFLAYKGGTVVGAQNVNDPRGGGHCMCLIGYETQAGGSRVFLLRNSWGTSWGNNGDAWVNEAFVKQMIELFAVSAKPAASIKEAA